MLTQICLSLKVGWQVLQRALAVFAAKVTEAKLPSSHAQKPSGYAKNHQPVQLVDGLKARLIAFGS